jgi:cyclic pyranopterin phosphate synthase
LDARRKKKRLTHIDRRGNPAMVSVSGKAMTRRTAEAEARVRMSASTLRLAREDRLAKGGVGAVVRLAGIQAAKRTCELIPLCHPIPLDEIAVDLAWTKRTAVIRTRVTTESKTGVEMEAMTAASVAALAFYDMVKSIERGVAIESIRLLRKSGGRSGNFEALRNPSPP